SACAWRSLRAPSARQRPWWRWRRGIASALGASMTMIAAASRRGISGVADRLRVSPEAPLHTFERRDPALGNNLLESTVILLVQVGVSCGELGDRTVEPAAGPEVRSD